MLTRAAAVLTALISVLAAGLVAATPASAVDAALRLVTPQAGSTVANSWSGPLEIDTSMAGSGSFDVTMSCVSGDGTQDVRELGTVSGSGSQPQSLSLSDPLGHQAQTCSVTAREYGSPALGLGTFNVAARTLALSGASLSATYFYPRIVDRYRDTVTLSWQVNQPARQSVKVVNSNGSTMRTATLSGDAAGSRSFLWNGRTNTGVPVAAGNYRIYVTATTPDGQTKTFYRSVSVRTAVIYVRKGLSRYGHVSSASRSGTCFVERDSYERTTSLDCWGGRFARAAYSFTLPSNATRVAYAVSGHRNYADLCCDGRILRTGTRVRSNLFRVLVTVTGWRAYDVTGVRVSYSVPVRR